jgi:DNA-binding NarL/FixJ family response regulator
MSSRKILIADDHVIIRRGLRFILNSHFSDITIHETDSLKGLSDILAGQSFTHLILDMQMQDGNLLDVFNEIKSKCKDVHILIYTMSPDEIFGKRLLQMGALGFLNKQSSEDEVIVALRLFLDNKKYISSQLQELLNQEQFDNKKSDNPINQLSSRELSVLNYLLKGDSLKDIAARLEVKPNTIATFKARLFDKLGVSNIIDLKNIAEIYNFRPS